MLVINFLQCCKLNESFRSWRLTLHVPISEEEKKLSYIFTSTLLCGASKGFMKALMTFIKPFESPQRSIKIKI